MQLSDVDYTPTLGELNQVRDILNKDSMLEGNTLRMDYQARSYLLNFEGINNASGALWNTVRFIALTSAEAGRYTFPRKLVEVYEITDERQENINCLIASIAGRFYLLRATFGSTGTEFYPIIIGNKSYYHESIESTESAEIQTEMSSNQEVLHRYMRRPEITVSRVHGKLVLQK